MLLKFSKFSMKLDLENGTLSSLVLNNTERISEPSALFTIRLRDREGRPVIISSREAKNHTKTDDGAIYSGFEPSISVRVSIKNENDEAAWRIFIKPDSSEYFIEWVDFPSINLPHLEENNTLGTGGKILFPYNEGALISDIDNREESFLRYTEPEYPSMGSYAIFPNMVCSQMLAYVWKDAGLYIGAHDKKRGVKDINFFKTDNGVTLRFRLFCGTDFGEVFNNDYPVIFSSTKGTWEASAERYRRWFESELPEGTKKISQNTALPNWYVDSPLVVSYPIRGIHDMDDMKPNKLYPYTNALPLLKEIKDACDSRLLVLLMHWEGTAPWAPPYVWPPFGDVDNFNLFLDTLHERDDMLGVYCSGFGYTIQSNLIDSYNMNDEYKKRELEKGMCADADGKIKISNICTGQRKGYDICPASPVGRSVLDEAYGVLLDKDLDYVQILDQNHGGGQYFCYSRNHGHPPAPGEWMTENMRSMLSDWNKRAKETLLGCESAAAEPFISNLLYSDNRFELNYTIGTPVPLYAFIYHEYVRNFMGNQVACPFRSDIDTLRYRLAYSFCAGDSMTIVLTPDGELLSDWGTRCFSSLPDKEKAFSLIRNLSKFYKVKAKKYLFAGRMIETPYIECDTVVFERRDAKRNLVLPAILSSAWEASDNERALILVNPNDCEKNCTVNEKNITVPALNAVLIQLP